MNEFIKCFILLQLSVQLLSVASYTVLLKQVKALHPAVKVYRYELRHPSTPYVYYKPLLGQRIYPVPLKHGKDASFKPRGAPLKIEKAKPYKGGEKPVSRDPRLQGLSQHLVPPVSNQLEENSEVKEQEDEVRPLVVFPDLGKSFSSFGQEKGRVYTNPGEWATPAPQTDAENTTKSEFTPSQLYLQIRHKSTVIHVPQSEALKDAETLEELINAPRLKELARTTHVQETYSEEGYEDAGYDHAGHIRHVQHGEVYDAKDEGKFKIKDPPVIIDYDSDLEESKKISTTNLSGAEKESGGENNKLEPRITRSRSEVSKTSAEYAKIPKSYKGDHKYSSRVKGPVKGLDERGNPFSSTESLEFQSVGATFPSYFGEMPPPPEGMLSNDSVLYYKFPSKKSSKYRNSTKIYPVTGSSSPSSDDFVQANGYSDLKPYISAADSQASPSAKFLKYSRIYSKKTKQLRLEPYKNENIYSPPPSPSVNPETPPHQDLQPPSIGETTGQQQANQRIILPTIGYINSLTTAHFGKDNSKPSQEEPKTQLTDALNLTQALDYLRSKKNQKSSESTKTATEVDLRTFEPMKLKSHPPYRSFIAKSKREVLLVKTRAQRSKQETENYEGNDENDAPHNEKNEEITEDERKRIEDENLEKEKYEADLREQISNHEKEILKETYKNIGVEEDISEVFPEFPSSDSESSLSSPSVETTSTAPPQLDVRKYPFYLSKRLPENSPLRYATDPKQFPRKSGYKMEFYESREGVIQCPDFHPDLGDLPDSHSTEYSNEQAGENQRIAGLGDKIACLRMKYFDPEPFDNPIFKEREIDYVGKRNWKKVRSKIEATSPSKPRKATRERSPSTKTGVHQNPVFYPGNRIIFQETRGKPTNLLETSTHQTNKTETPKIIPVTETLDDLPPQPATVFPSIWWTTIYRSRPSPQVQSSFPTPANQPHTRRYLKTPPKHLVVPRNCLKNLSNLTVYDGTDNLTVYCNDATLFQEVVGNVAHLRIIPKKANEYKKQVQPAVPSDESEWVPILGYPTTEPLKKLHRPLTRRTDRVTKLKNETSHNITNSDHYVIDELKEEENVRKGEVMDDMDHYMKLLEESKEEEKEVATVEAETKTETPLRERREAHNDTTAEVPKGDEIQKPDTASATDIGKLSEPKRPLTRLSGRYFLIRYHKNRGKPGTTKPEDFWKVPNNQELWTKTKETGKPVTPTPKTTETSTNKVSDSQQSNSFIEKDPKYKTKRTEFRKISPPNVTPEKITKRPEVNTPEFWKTTAPNLVNPSKIVTKVSREMSQSTDRPRIVRKHKDSPLTPKPENLETGTSSAKPEVPEHKTPDENSPGKESERSSDTTEGPILYYVVNLKTGRGKWINKLRRAEKGASSVKYQKSQKPKENYRAKGRGRQKKEST